MAARSVKMTVVVAPAVVNELYAIWTWNAERYGSRHADAYLRFLERSTSDLAFRFAQGTPLGQRNDWRYILLRRKANGHGHLAVYYYDERVIHVLHVFHTAQDWPSQLDDQSSSTQ